MESTLSPTLPERLGNGPVREGLAVGLYLGRFAMARGT